jgi:exodeoxyribonuclease-3
MKVININVNGIRAATKKGLFDWLLTQNADIICVQELRCAITDLPNSIINWNNYYNYFYPAEQKGYSGVAIYSKYKPQNIIYGINHSQLDAEGRYIQLDYKDLSVISVYLPSGSSGIEKQNKKYAFMNAYQPILFDQLTTKRNYIICGDLNIAHQEIDLKNWKGNLQNSGFLPQERQWLTRLFNKGFIDCWRHLYPEIPGYTWWSNRGSAYKNNVGWRIDYQIITPNLFNILMSGAVFTDIKFSDHAPLIMEYKYEIIQ